MKRLCAATLVLGFVACTVEEAIPTRADAGPGTDSGPGPDASVGGSAGNAGTADSGPDPVGDAADASDDAPLAQDSSGGSAGSDSSTATGGSGGIEGGVEADAAGCPSGEVRCDVAGAPTCWGTGTDCSTLTECKGGWAACAQSFTPHCGDVRGFACCPASLPVFCDVSGPSFGCWEQGIDCSTITDCAGVWYACPAGQKYVCSQGCKGN